MQTVRPTRSFAGVLLLGAVALSACKDNAPPPPVAIVATSAFTFTGVVDEVLPSPLTVKVTDASGAAVNGVPVTFVVADGGGSVSKAVDTTKSGGTASTSWRLGERVVAQRVTASALGVSSSIEFTATAKPGAPATIVLAAGNTQSAAAGTAVATPPSVSVRDRFTNVVPGVSVLFSVTGGGGSITGAGVATNAAGVAAVGEWKLGTALGANSLSALAVASGITGNPVSFTATAVAGAAATIVPQGSTSLTGTVFTAVAPLPSVRVTDANGNAVSGATVTFTGSAGSTVVGGTRTTDASGLATPEGWVLGTQARSYTLVASVGTLPAATFTATARAAAAATGSAAAGANQSALAGRSLDVDPAVRVLDAYGNPVAGVEVVYDVTSGGGTAVSRRPLTDATGIAAVGGWTLGDAVGTNTLRATVQASNVTGNPVTFTATGTAGSASLMVAQAGQNQTVTAGSDIPVAPAVVVRDSRGNPVSGVSVTFSIGSGGGTVTGGTSTTSSTGVATVGSWTLGPATGVQSLIARSAGLPDVTFTATATAGAAARAVAWSAPTLSGITVGSNLTVSQRPAVRVTDNDGNPVSGVAVTFAVVGNVSTSATGTIVGAATTTNANGIATLGGWTVPTGAGTTATVVGVADGLTEEVTFSVTTIAGAATGFLVSRTPAGNITENTDVSVSAQLRDQFGNVVSRAGVSVTFTVSTGGGTIATASTATALTNSSGIATITWTVGASTTAAQSLTISGGGLTSTSVGVTVVAVVPPGA